MLASAGARVTVVDISPEMLRLDAELADGYVREWQLRMLPPERHVGYAIQWFSLAGTLLVIAVILSARSRKSCAAG